MESFNTWKSLLVYSQEGYIRINKNATENKIRPFAVRRKNWLFTGHCERAQASANLFKVVENAKLYNLKVFNYLVKDYEMLTRKYASADLPKLKSTQKTMA